MRWILSLPSTAIEVDSTEAVSWMGVSTVHSPLMRMATLTSSFSESA